MRPLVKPFSTSRIREKVCSLSGVDALPQTQGGTQLPDPGRQCGSHSKLLSPHLYEGLVRCRLKVPSVPRAKLRAACHSLLKLQLQPPKGFLQLRQ